MACASEELPAPTPTSTSAPPEAQSTDRVLISRHPTNPNGPHHITCLHSDASQSRWPVLGPAPQLSGQKGAPAQWDLTEEQSKIRSKWLCTLGRSMADVLGLLKSHQKEDWKLIDFPANYQLFTYTKGNRQDQYLMGSQTVSKFRTANEFLPHLHWLTSTTATLCQCKYCSGTKNQSEINSNIALGVQYTTKPSQNKRKLGPPPSIKPLASVEDPAYDPANGPTYKKRKTGYHSLSPSTAPPQSVESDENKTTKPAFEGPYLHPRLDRDLAPDGSNFRQHELVWCEIHDLSVGPRTDALPRGFDMGTPYWPGLCEEALLVIESNECVDLSVDDDPHHRISKTSNILPLKKKKGRPRLDAKPDVRLYTKVITHKHKYQWKVRLLGVEDVIVREDCQLLPWLFKPVDLVKKFSGGPDPEASLPHYLSRPLQFHRPRLDSFSSAKNARVAFQLALQIAGNIEEFWGAIDRYDCVEHGLELDSSFPPRRLQAPYIHPEGTPDSPLNSPKIWFQSLWWGAERIWVYDMVRLNKVESDLPDQLVANDTSIRHINENDKAYFLKIDRIYRDELEKKLVTIGKIFDLVAVSSPTPTTTTDENIQPSSTPMGCPFKDPKPDEVPEDESDESRRHMPSPPAGYRFRQLTPFGLSHHVYLECISGRYYPPAPKNHNDRMNAIARRLLSRVSLPKPSVGTSIPGPKMDNLICINSSLFGFTAGRWNYMRCRKWREDRKKSIVEAESVAEAEMIQAFTNLTTDPRQT